MRGAAARPAQTSRPYATQFVGSSVVRTLSPSRYRCRCRCCFVVVLVLVESSFGSNRLSFRNSRHCTDRTKQKKTKRTKRLFETGAAKCAFAGKSVQIGAHAHARRSLCARLVGPCSFASRVAALRLFAIRHCRCCCCCCARARQNEQFQQFALANTPIRSVDDVSHHLAMLHQLGTIVCFPCAACHRSCCSMNARVVVCAQILVEDATQPMIVFDAAWLLRLFASLVNADPAIIKPDGFRFHPFSAFRLIDESIFVACANKAC